MYNKTVRQFTCRMSYDDEEQVKIMQTLDDLNTDVYKSVNRFMIEALKYYIKAINDGTLTNAEASQKKDYVTRNEIAEMMLQFDEKLKEAKEEVKSSLYEELFKLLTGTLIAANSPFSQKTLVDPSLQQSETGGSHNSEEQSQNKTEDISGQLSQFDNVLSQVMSWGDE